MLPRSRVRALLLARGLGYEHWLVDGRDGETGIPLPVAMRVLATAARDRKLARELCDMLRSLGGRELAFSSELLWQHLQPLLTTGRLVVVERKRALPCISGGAPIPEYHEPPAPAPLEPVLIDDVPSLTRFVALVLLDIDGDGDHVVNLPLYVDHRNGRIDCGKTNSSGKLEVRQLPPDHRWSIFSGYNPKA